ncbi:hypothetical protein BH11PSE12_BH11PSE12_18460 [soil metagenome]
MTTLLEWMARMEAAIQAGQLPTYALLEEGVAELLEESKKINYVNNEMLDVFSKMVIARHCSDVPGVLLELDNFIKKRVVIKPMTDAIH